MMPVLSTVEEELSLHKHNIVKDPQKNGSVKKVAANNERAKVRNYISELHYQADS